MTYKAHLEQLLAASIEKSNAFVESIKISGQSNTPIPDHEKDEWEASENAFSAFLNLIKANQINIHEEMPEVSNPSLS